MIKFYDEWINEGFEFCYEWGIFEFVEYLNCFSDLLYEEVIYFNGYKDDVFWEIVF